MIHKGNFLFLWREDKSYGSISCALVKYHVSNAISKDSSRSYNMNNKI